MFFWEKMFIESEIQKIIGQSSHLIPPENIRKSKISGVFTRYKMETLLRNVLKCFLSKSQLVTSLRQEKLETIFVKYLTSLRQEKLGITFVKYLSVISFPGVENLC